MRVLVTGGTGMVGASTVRALLDRGHAVRVLSRNVTRDSQIANERLERWPGDVTDATSLHGSADHCSAVLHLVGVVDEQSTAETVERVNLHGTRNVILEAERGTRRGRWPSSSSATISLDRHSTSEEPSSRRRTILCDASRSS